MQFCISKWQDKSLLMSSSPFDEYKLYFKLIFTHRLDNSNFVVNPNFLKFKRQLFQSVWIQNLRSRNNKNFTSVISFDRKPECWRLVGYFKDPKACSVVSRIIIVDNFINYSIAQNITRFSKVAILANLYHMILSFNREKD